MAYFIAWLVCMCIPVAMATQLVLFEDVFFDSIAVISAFNAVVLFIHMLVCLWKESA